MGKKAGGKYVFVEKQKAGAARAEVWDTGHKHAGLGDVIAEKAKAEERREELRR